MVIRGRVKEGVVVLEDQVSLPEGTQVTVAVCAPPEAAAQPLPEEERRRIRKIMDRIAALPDENPGDTFTGADHDQVLYGEPG
jgi:hypothetical protein